MKTPTRWAHFLRVCSATTIALLVLNGCLPWRPPPEPEGWGAVEDRRLAEMRADPWLRGSPGHQSLSPYRYHRPSVHRELMSDADEPWREAAAEVAEAEQRGWAPVFVACSAPEGLVQVDLVRELSDGSPATARIVVAASDSIREHRLEVRAVAMHHLDGDWVQTPPLAPQPDFDAGTCLDEHVEGYHPRWSGTPVMLDVYGDSPPAE